MLRLRVPYGLWLLAPASVLAQPAAPTPARMAELRAMSVVDPRLAAAATPLTVNTASREEVRQFFRAIYAVSDGVPMGWTGSYTTGAAGDTGAVFKEAVRVRINFFRALAGVPAAITLNSTFGAKAQQAALMMSANTALQHTGIPTTWTFYTAAGAEAAANSNLALGSSGPDSITGYIRDDGINNDRVGHRRWVLYPQTREMGTGDVPGTGTLLPANATWIVDSQYGATRPATRTTHVPWPPAGFVPYQLVWPRWSFSYPGADFSTATVTMTRAGENVVVGLEALATNIGEPTLVWRYDNLSPDAAASHARPASDTTYTVNVNNVRIGGAAQNFSYNVTVFDPDVAGADAPPVAVTGPAAPTVGAANSYSVAKPAFADSFDWRTLTLGTFTKTYNAENGLDNLTATTTAGYNVVQSIAVGAGAAAFRLAHISPFTPQLLTLPETFYVNSAGAAVTLLSRLGIATAAETARVQVSPDDGVSWTDVYAQAGTSASNTSFPVATEAAFASRSVSLGAFAGRTVRVRLAFTVEEGGLAFIPTATNTVGWFVDNLTLTGVQTVTTSAATNIPGGGAVFTLIPTATGALGLQARGVLFGAYPLEWGPVTFVTATGAGGTVDLTRLINLSILANLAAGEKMTMGTVLGGTGTSGTKALLARAAGPSLVPFGITAFLPNPRMTLNSTSVSPAVVVAQAAAWGGTAALTNAFAAVAAFPYTSTTSNDSALFRSGTGALPAGNYTVEVVDANNAPGTVITELYDSTPTGTFTATTPRLINVSVLKQIGAGTTLTAGFVVGPGNVTAPMKVLVRAVGPTLGVAPFGLGGTMADPKLELFNNATGAKIYENNDWATPVAPLTTTAAQLTTVFNSVAAFGLASTATKDAVLYVTLPPGQYSAQVKGADGGGGWAIVEVYEIP